MRAPSRRLWLVTVVGLGLLGIGEGLHMRTLANEMVQMHREIRALSAPQRRSPVGYRAIRCNPGPTQRSYVGVDGAF